MLKIFGTPFCKFNQQIWKKNIIKKIPIFKLEKLIGLKMSRRNTN